MGTITVSCITENYIFFLPKALILLHCRKKRNKLTSNLHHIFEKGAESILFSRCHFIRNFRKVVRGKVQGVANFDGNWHRIAVSNIEKRGRGGYMIS